MSGVNKLYKILVVEDEKLISDIIKFSLEKEGYQVVTAYDGNEAIRLYEEQKPDLILLDIMLPNKDGFEVCKGVRRAGLITPILMLTARSLTADKIAGLKIGADDYVTKPFDMSELCARVEALLRRAPVRAAPQSDGFRFGLCHRASQCFVTLA